MVSTSLELYANVIPFEYPVKEIVDWSSSVSDASVSPDTGMVLFIDKLHFLATDDFDITGGDFTIKHSDGPTDQYLAVTIDDDLKLLSMADELKSFSMHTDTNRVKGMISFDPPIKCADESGQSFEIDEDSLTLTGGIIFTISGWQMTESDYNSAT